MIRIATIKNKGDRATIMSNDIVMSKVRLALFPTMLLSLFEPCRGIETAASSITFTRVILMFLKKIL